MAAAMDEARRPAHGHLKKPEAPVSRLKQIAWTILALIFLAVSWAWEALAPVVQATIDLIPLRAVKAWANRVLDRLRPYPTLLVFAIPLGLSEGIKIVSYVAFAHKQFMLGLVTYLLAEIVRYGLAAYIWNVCRDKLLSIGWVAKLHAWLLVAHDWANAQTAPIKAWIKQALVEAGLTSSDAGLWLRVKALWRYSRRKTA
jgi:hypothetical protein